MPSYGPLKNEKEVKMRVVLPSWLGNSGCWDILPLSHVNIRTALFFRGPITETNDCTYSLPEIPQHSQTHGCGIVTLRSRKFL